MKMRKLRDRILPLLLGMLCILVLLPTKTFAARAIDLNRNVTLTIRYTHNGRPVSDVRFDLYYVADVNEYAEFTLAGDFANYPLKINDLTTDGLKTLAETLKSYVEQDRLKPLDSGKTDDNGMLAFPNERKSLKPGLYLVVGKTLTKDGFSYKTEPFLVSLPNSDGNSKKWNYDVTVEPKHIREELPPTPSDDTVTRKVLKVWKDDVEKLRPQEVVIRLLKDGEVYDTVTLNKKNNWSYTWKELPKYNKDGSKAEWSVTEKAVDDYTVLIEKNGITYIVTNTYTPITPNDTPTDDTPTDETTPNDTPTNDTVKRVVTKVWDDVGYESSRPKSVQVTLLQNGTAYDTVTLSEENDWLYTWENLPECDADGKEYSWTIQEAFVPDYVADVEQNGYTFVLTNTLDRPKLPQTGVLWWPVPLLAVGGITFLIVGALSGKKKEHE